jgi:hypothetical protein
LKERALAFGYTFARCLEEWFEKAVYLFWMAVVCMESYEDIVLFCENVRRFCENNGSKGCVIDV